MPTTESTLADLRVAAWLDFVAGFQRSRRGNLWRNWDGKTLTVFNRRDGLWGWSIADRDGPRFSRRGHEDDESAMLALYQELDLADAEVRP